MLDIFTYHNKEYYKYNLEDKLKKYQNIKFKFLKLKDDTRGALETTK